MLVLMRRENEWLDLTYPGGTIRILIVSAAMNIRLGIEAPPEVQIVRDDAKNREPRERKVQQ